MDIFSRQDAVTKLNKFGAPVVDSFSQTPPDSSGYSSYSSDSANSRKERVRTPSTGYSSDSSGGSEGAQLPPLLLLNEVRYQCFTISRDVVKWAAHHENFSVESQNGSPSATLYLVSQTILEQRAEMFAEMAGKFLLEGITDGSGGMRPGKKQKSMLYGIFAAIADELFADGEYNWGRLTVFYAFVIRFTQHIADCCKDERAVDDFVSLIGSVVGRCIAERAAFWITVNDGWDGFVDRFSNLWNAAPENSFIKRILLSGLGLGILTGMWALR